MINTRKWAARAAVVGVTASVLIGVNASPSSALGSTCPHGGQRPNGLLTSTLLPPFGSGPGTLNVLYGVTNTLDAVICQVLP